MMPAKEEVFVGVGSNLKKPQAQVIQAVTSLQHIKNTKVLAVSSWYQSKALGGPGGQPDYINGVVKLETDLEALTLLDALQKIENEHKRIRAIRWGARTLDLDILLYGEEHIMHPRLTVPHLSMLERNFVMTPLAELDPEVRIPHDTGNNTAAEHSLRLGTEGLIQLERRSF